MESLRRGEGYGHSLEDIIVKPHGPTDLVVNVDFFSVKEARIHNATSSDEEKAAISPSALSLDVRWSRNSVNLRVILMLVNTAKYAGAPKRCMTNLEKSGLRNSTLLRTTRK